jgi:hypothetical protein
MTGTSESTPESAPLCGIIVTLELRKLFKIGIYRELQNKGLLTQKQLEQLLSNSGAYLEEK